MLKILLNTGILRNTISKIASKALKNKFDCNAKIDLEDLQLCENESGDEIYIHIDGAIRMSKTDFKKILDTIS